METQGWRPTGDGHWQILHQGRVIGLADTEPANFIRTPDGAVHSIDAVPFIATRAMLEHWAGRYP